MNDNSKIFQVYSKIHECFNSKNKLHGEKKENFMKLLIKKYEILAQLQIESIYLPTSFIVLEDQSMDMLLGLDMLKRHQCILDLQKGVLRIGTSGTETRFLPESKCKFFYLFIFLKIYYYF